MTKGKAKRIFGTGVAATAFATQLSAQPLIFVCDDMGDLSLSVHAQAGQALVIGEMGMDSGDSTFQVPLQEAQSGSGTRYEGDGYEFVARGTEGVLFPEGDPAITCQAADDGMGEATPDAAGGGIEMNARAMSLGGRVRSGPGMDYTRLGSIAQGMPITLLENTGVMMNGYPWFRIRVATGEVGYQWGGIICDPAARVSGVFERC